MQKNKSKKYINVISIVGSLIIISLPTISISCNSSNNDNNHGNDLVKPIINELLSIRIATNSNNNSIDDSIIIDSKLEFSNSLLPNDVAYEWIINDKKISNNSSKYNLVIKDNKTIVKVNAKYNNKTVSSNKLIIDAKSKLKSIDFSINNNLKENENINAEANVSFIGKKPNENDIKYEWFVNNKILSNNNSKTLNYVAKLGDRSIKVKATYNKKSVEKTKTINITSSQSPNSPETNPNPSEVIKYTIKTRMPNNKLFVFEKEEFVPKFKVYKNNTLIETYYDGKNFYGGAGIDSDYDGNIIFNLPADNYNVKVEFKNNMYKISETNFTISKLNPTKEIIFTPKEITTSISPEQRFDITSVIPNIKIDSVNKNKHFDLNETKRKGKMSIFIFGATWCSNTKKLCNT